MTVGIDSLSVSQKIKPEVVKYRPEGTDVTYKLQFEKRKKEPSSLDATDYTQDIEVKILDDAKNKIGWLSGILIFRSLATLRNISLYDVFDSNSEYLYRIYSELADLNTESFDENVFGDELAFEDLLTIWEVCIVPKHRANELAIWAIAETVKHYGHRLVIAQIAPHRYQESDGTKYKKLQEPHRKATPFDITKLQSYFKKLGFKPIGETKYFFLDAWNLQVKNSQTTFHDTTL